MTRDETLALYQPMRANLKGALRKASRSLLDSDLERAARQIGLWRHGRIHADSDAKDDAVTDVALFEVNPVGVRPVDRFLARDKGGLTEDERAILQQVASNTRVALLKFPSRHPAAGVMMVDQVEEPERETWFMDETFDKTPPPRDQIYAMRVADMGPFHIGFGFGVIPSELAVLIIQIHARDNLAPPFRYPLSATLYADGFRTRDILSGPLQRRLLDTIARLRKEARD
jgi:hypothetical protein